MVTTKISLIDFNSMPCYYDVLTKKGASYEHGQNYFFSSDGIPASIRIPQMRPTLSGRLQDGPVSKLHKNINFADNLCFFYLKGFLTPLILPISKDFVPSGQNNPLRGVKPRQTMVEH